MRVNRMRCGKNTARAVVFGGGVVGVSTLYHLAKMGWSDAVVLERKELTSGSTWHAAGLLPLFNLSYSVGKLHQYSVGLYARSAAALGVDIIQNCAVTGIRRGANGAVEGVETTRGYIASKRVGVSAAGNSSVVMQMAGLDFPLESYPAQALVSEPVKPTFPCVVLSNTVHAYMSQSDKGELVIGAGTDQYVRFSQRGALHIVEHTLAAICEIFPIYRRIRMLRTWGGIVDVTPDRSPILGKTPVKGLYVNCGWGTGGFKSAPGAGDLLASTMVKDEQHPINAPYNLDRFRNGRLIDEAAAAAVSH
jgi:sarcosine oxidase, subunit beta